MRAVLALSLLGACGRVGFDGERAPDARGLATDVPAASYAGIVLADNPELYFRLDEPGDGIAHDATGHGYDVAFDTFDGGTISFGVPGALSGDPDTAVLFEGDGNVGPTVGASVELPKVPMWTGDFTAELLVKPDGAASNGYDNALVVCEHYMTNGFRTGWNSDSALHVWTNEAGASTSVASTAQVAIGAWNHVVFVHRGGTAEIYLDGVQVLAMPLDYNPVDPEAECGFGAFHGMPTHGAFDEVAGYDYALSAAQIAAHQAAR